MTAQPSAPVLQDRHVFERNLTRALWLGPLLGVATRAVLSWAGVSDANASLGLAAVLVGIGLAVSIDAGDTLDRLLLSALSLLPPAVWLIWTFRNPAPLWPFVAGTFVLGLLPVRAQRCRTGVEGGLARARPSPVHDLAGALATALLATVGFMVGGRFGDALERAGAPEMLQFAAVAFCLSLFAGLGALAAHLWLVPDPIERRAEQLLRRLPREIVPPVQRALVAYRACGERLATLPRHAVRDELAQTVSRLTVRILEGAEAWAPLEAQVGPKARATLSADAAALAERAARATDPIAQGHLERAAQALAEEVSRISGMEVEREREVARLEADAALLEQARVALLNADRGLRTRGLSEVEALSRRLQTLSALQRADHDAIQEGAAAAQSTPLEAPGHGGLRADHVEAEDPLDARPAGDATRITTAP